LAKDLKYDWSKQKNNNMNIVRRSSALIPSMLTGGLDNSFFDFNGFQQNKEQVAVNILEEKTHYIIQMAVPGFNKEEISVELKENKLSISGKKVEPTDKHSEESFLRKEFGIQSFEKSFTLPKQITSENIKGTCQAGVLTLTLTKPVKVEPDVKRIALV